MTRGCRHGNHGTSYATDYLCPVRFYRSGGTTVSRLTVLVTYTCKHHQGASRRWE